MNQKIVQIDAFTAEPFTGNPAAVCPLQSPADEHWMQLVARELNLSETAFFYPVEDGYNLRWFTPAVEVEMCGHATLAAAHFLYESGALQPDQEARFHTLSGLLTACKLTAAITLNFPATPPRGDVERAPLQAALGVEPVFAGATRFDALVVVDSATVVREMKPDFRMLKSLDYRGVMVTALSDDPQYDFISRFFAPACGIDEDPVTGSAHCALGPYWGEILHKTDLRAYQASERGGTVGVSLRGERVELTGQAVTVIEGVLR